MGFPPGHYHSPIPDLDELRGNGDRIWRPREQLTGVDIQVSEQLGLLENLRQHATAIDYPVEAPVESGRYFYSNGLFPMLDAEFLFSALCAFRPQKIVEVGSGFSSLVMADVNRRMFNGRMDISCIDPNPRDFLIAGVDGITRLLPLPLQLCDPALFTQLGAGDLLFIDSSHVSKVDSDVNFFFFELLPLLKPGVYVHLHDIFLPDEYPKSWVLEEQRSWTEQYLLHAFLMFNREWRVVWMAHYMLSRHREAVLSVFPRCAALGAGGSFWMQRRPNHGKGK